MDRFYSLKHSSIDFHFKQSARDFVVEEIPLYEFSGRVFNAFSVNPIDGYFPHYPPVRIVEIYSNTTWSCPPIKDKEMLVVPIGPSVEGETKGPMCVILSPNKLDINRPLSDIL